MESLRLFDISIQARVKCASNGEAEGLVRLLADRAEEYIVEIYGDDDVDMEVTYEVNEVKV